MPHAINQIAQSGKSQTAGFRVKEGLHGCLAVVPTTLVGADLIVVAEPLVEVGLQLGDAAVELLAEGHPVELVEHGLVEALADAIIRYARCRCRRRLVGSLTTWHMVSPSGT